MQSKSRRFRASATTPQLRGDRDAADERVKTVTTQLIAGACNDCAGLVALNPEPHGRRLESTHGQIDVTQERLELIDVTHATRLESHAPSQSPTGWMGA
jgi:hypothetical protein